MVMHDTLSGDGLTFAFLGGIFQGFERGEVHLGLGRPGVAKSRVFGATPLRPDDVKEHKRHHDQNAMY